MKVFKPIMMKTTEGFRDAEVSLFDPQQSLRGHDIIG
jgi:hypothetical protein